MCHRFWYVYISMSTNTYVVNAEILFFCFFFEKSFIVDHETDIRTRIYLRYCVIFLFLCVSLFSLFFLLVITAVAAAAGAAFFPFSFICIMLSYYSINTISFSFSFFSCKQNDIHSTNFDVPHFFAYLCTLTHCAIVKITTNRRLNRKTKNPLRTIACLHMYLLYFPRLDFNIIYIYTLFDVESLEMRIAFSVS